MFSSEFDEVALIRGLTEFNKIEELLKRAGIEYEREDNTLFGGAFDHHQIHSPTYTAKWWDQIPGWFSIIWQRGSFGEEEGLLEIWCDSEEEPKGGLTAEECFDHLQSFLDRIETEELEQGRFENGDISTDTKNDTTDTKRR